MVKENSENDTREESDERAAVTLNEIPISELKETPLRKLQVMGLFLVLLNEGLCSSMLFPFVGLYVAHLRGVDVNSAGYYSGFLIGCFMLGQVVSARLWGYLSDVYGRRFPLFFGLFMNGIAMMGFGLSSNIYMCIFFRFMHGLFNGNILVAKTMMSDITDRTNISRGFSYVSLCFTMGFSVGPIIGGVLYDPSKRWSIFSKTGAFAKYPALLPSLCIFIYTYLGMFVVICFLKETNPHAKPLPRVLQLLTPFLRIQKEPFVPHPNPSLEAFQARLIADEEEQREFDNMSFNSLREEYLTQSGFVNHPKECDFLSELGSTTKDDFEHFSRGTSPKEGVTTNESNSTTVEETEAETDGKVKNFGYREAFHTPVLRMVLTQYVFMSAGELTLKECFPLFAVASADRYGLEMTTSGIAIALILNSVPCLAANLLFPRLSKRYNNQLGLLRVGSLVGCVAILLFTLPPMLFTSRNLVITLMVLCMCTSSFFCTFCFSINSVITTKAAPPGHIGATMGIMQSVGAVVRMVTPFIVAPLFALSISGNHIYPFNYALVFILCSLCYATLYRLSYNLRTTPAGVLERT